MVRKTDRNVNMFHFLCLCTALATSIFGQNLERPDQRNTRPVYNEIDYDNIKQPNFSCGKLEFRCQSGACIPEENVCDGVKDCMDESDETMSCQNIPCNTMFLFKCKYGACISRFLQCDGKRDCLDGSDEIGCGVGITMEGASSQESAGSSSFSTSNSESNSSESASSGMGGSGGTGSGSRPGGWGGWGGGWGVGRPGSGWGSKWKTTTAGSTLPPTRVTTGNGCTIPLKPLNGNHTINDKPVNYAGGLLPEFLKAPALSALFVNCDPGFWRQPDVLLSVCRNGTWTPEPSTCIDLWKTESTWKTTTAGSTLPPTRTTTPSTSSDRNQSISVICGSSEFDCGSEQCINTASLCDFVQDCSNNRDESLAICGDRNCAPGLFKCFYGSCVPYLARCDGRKDCEDGSDERYCVIEQLKPSLDASCRIPLKPLNGNHTVNNKPINYSLLSVFRKAPHLSTLIVSCNPGFWHQPENAVYSVCRNTTWMPEPATCIATCPPLNFSDNSTALCEMNGKRLSTCENAVDGTVVITACDLTTTSSNSTGNLQNCSFQCRAGKWILVSAIDVSQLNLNSNMTLNVQINVYPDFVPNN